jgi:hypothetical protein
MIDRIVDQAIASLLATIQGLKVLVGAEDIEPALQAPFCVVYSEITGMSGRTPIYALVTRVEYNSIAGFDTMSQTEADMTAIDNLIGPGGDYSTNPAVSAAGLAFLGWEAISRSTQEFGDRRKNVRELAVKAQPS